MPLQQMLARVRLELPSNVRWTVLRVYLHEQVNVVACNLQRKNFAPEVVGGLTKQLSNVTLHYIMNWVAILRTSNEVILARTNRMRVTAVLLHPDSLHV